MLTAAILGLGRWGSELIEAVQGASPAIRFKSAVVTDPAKYAALAERHRIAVGTDYAAVLADPEIQAVVIATPHTQHAAQTIAAAEAGKHVLCEKPFTVDSAEARAAFAAADAAGVACVVGFQRRFLRPYRELARRLEAGAIGRVFHVECNQSAPSGLAMKADAWRTRPNEFRGGNMGGHGIHMVDAVIGLLGEFADVTATARRQILEVDIHDTTFLTFNLKRGCTGYLASMFATAHEHRLQVFGTEGWLEMRDHRVLTFQPRQGPREHLDFGESPLLRDELERFAGVVAGTDTWPVSRGQALHGQAVFDAIADSVDDGGTVAVAG